MVSTFDDLTRHFGSTLTRRGTARGLVRGALALLAGGAVSHETDAKRRKKRRKKKPVKMGDQSTAPPPPPPAVNACAGKNWCVDRSQTCGPAGGYGKCLVEVSGGNVCAEILFQVASCTECESPNCLDCRCVLAAGGGDRCNNGVNGFDFICVRDV